MWVRQGKQTSISISEKIRKKPKIVKDYFIANIFAWHPPCMVTQNECSRSARISPKRISLARAKAGRELNKSQQPITAIADTRTITQKRETEREREKRERERERGKEREGERERRREERKRKKTAIITVY